MASPVIVIHYHELWLKGRNRRFFLARLASALRHALDGLPLAALERPGDRVIVRLKDPRALEEALRRVRRVFGVAYCAVAQSVERDLDALCQAAWNEIEPLSFRNFAVRAKRSDKSFPHNSMQIEAAVGRYLLEQSRAAGRDVRVLLEDPEITCRVEITPGPALVYARKIPGPGGLPTNSSGRMVCLLSGGFDSAVAAYRMMARGAHVSFVHFFGGGARPGESSVHVARELLRCLVQYQYSAKLYCVALEPIQREVVRSAPESFRILLYRRMMVRIAARLAHQERALALITGDSLGQVASQTLQNMVAVGAAAHMPIFRPLAGTDKLDIMAQAREIGTYETSAEPFHDCCPIFLPRNPALHATPQQLEAAESKLDVSALVREAVRNATLQRFRYLRGQVEEEIIAPKQAPVSTAEQTA
jgi:thiamine biosynthesis protein ThiI